MSYPIIMKKLEKEILPKNNRETFETHSIYELHELFQTGKNETIHIQT